MGDRKEYQKQYYLDHAEERKQYARQYLIAHPEERKECNRQYRIDHLEECKQQEMRYWQTPTGKATQQRAKSQRRVFLKEALNTLTAEEWQAILVQHDFKCAYCGCSLLDLFNPPTRDHITPLSRGGDNTKENITPACRSCNSSKGAKEVVQS